MSRFIGKNISFSIFGQSHAEKIGITIDGIPAGIKIDEENIIKFLRRRAPSSSVFSTPRREEDKPVFLSGVFNGRSTGNAICAVIHNSDQASADYNSLKNIPRPGHADYCAMVKYGGFGDNRGGGAFSGRLTAPLCILGGIAKDFLAERGIMIGSHILSIGGVNDLPFDCVNLSGDEIETLDKKDFRTLSEEKGIQMLEKIGAARNMGDSLGGVVECAAICPSDRSGGLPVGLGGELFDGLEPTLAQLIFAVPAVKGLEFGAGFKAAEMSGSKNNDEFYFNNSGFVRTHTNNHGGLLGGMTSGMPLVFRAAFKPTPSIALPQKTVDLERKENTQIEIKGRHDACIVPRVLPVVESCAAIALFDELITAE